MRIKVLSGILVLFLLLTAMNTLAQKLDDFKYTGNKNSSGTYPVKSEFLFNGYTNYWHDDYTNWFRYGNLFKIATGNVEKNILQSKVDVAEDMGLPGLLMQESFVDNLFSSAYKVLKQPDKTDLENSASNGNVLVFIDPKTDLGKELIAEYSKYSDWPYKLKSHQYGTPDLKRINAFILHNGDSKIFVVSSTDSKSLDKFKNLINNTKNIIEKYDFHRGWFGVKSMLKSVTIADGHPLELIGKGMNEGNSWFVFSGYMDIYAKNELTKWMKEVNLPIVTDVGFPPVFGCKDYDGFQDRLMTSRELWADFAGKKNGYIFRKVSDSSNDFYRYDGYFATEGNKEQIDNDKIPFVLETGYLKDNLTSCMVLFLKKGEPLNRESMWQAIFDRREVGVLEKGKMMGPVNYRNALEMLILDRVFLENYFNDKLNIEAKTDGYDLQVSLTNYSNHSVSGILELTLPKSLKVKESTSLSIKLPSGSLLTEHFTIQPDIDAMAGTNPVAVHYKWNGKQKSTLAMLDMPPAISVHRLLYGHAPRVSYPVTIHNFTNKSSFPVDIQVIDAVDETKIIYKTSQTCSTKTGTFKDMLFTLKVPAGNYKVKVSALGTNYKSQLGIGKAKGTPTVKEIDLNSDGINEYQLENDSVQVTLLTTGARIIEYIVKSRNDNVLFKLWPKKVIDDKRPFRERGFYPYGGFEDFLGQGSMENHQVYNAEIVKSNRDYVRVRMWTDYFGNKLEKTFTLYGNSPLLEIRYALTFKNPEANIIGPQPMLSLGERHWTEDIFTIPEMDGIHEYRMKPHRYGMIFQLKEGWNAGYDTKQDISYVGAYPVDQPLFLHMFLNEPGNHDSHYFYGEFQPWVPIILKSTLYFTYYMWGTGGTWEKGVKALRRKNLITTRQK